MAMMAMAAGFVVVACFSFLLVTFGLSYAGSGDPAQDATAGCAGALCGPASQVGSAIPDFPVNHPGRPAPRHHRQTVTPSPSSEPTRHGPAPAPPTARVKVTFTADKRWDGGFQGELTISNNTNTAISAWRIAITLPGDRITSVWNADDQTRGDMLILEPTSWDSPIPPGGHESVFFVAKGPRVVPTSCTYNGVACS